MLGRLGAHLTWRLDEMARRRVDVAMETRGTRFATGYAEQAVFDDPPWALGDLEAYFDGNLVGPGIWKWRHYFAIYERHLARFRDQGVGLVEIGIYSGGSLGMWQSYLGSGATVYGVDIEPACKAYEAPGRRVFIGDQADPAFWSRFVAEVPAFDIVIDDGGHETHQQISAFEALFPYLRPGGVYICEDIHTQTNGFIDYVEALHRELCAVIGPDVWSLLRTTAWQRTVNSIHAYPFMTIVEKRARVVDEFTSERRGTQWQPFYEEEEA